MYSQINFLLRHLFRCNRKGVFTAAISLICTLWVLNIPFIRNYHKGVNVIHVVHTEKRTVRNNSLQQNLGRINNYNTISETELSDIFISVKTTKKNSDKRLEVLLETWVEESIEETFIFTDAGHQIPNYVHADHFIVTSCRPDHGRKALCCKTGVEFNTFLTTEKRWFCHVDDDTYVNVPALVKLLQNFTYTKDWYIGNPSLNRSVIARIKNKKQAFWFATGAGFCISRGLAEKMKPYTQGRHFEKLCVLIRLNDDCTLGYIINNLLKVPLTKKLFRHKYERNLKIPLRQLKDQITINGQIEIQGYSKKADPTRFRSIHCHLNPTLKQCEDMPR